MLARPSVAVAPELLGGVLAHVTASGAVAIRLTEVEAYMGAVDPGSHAYRGRTQRNDVMFGPPGHLYVYRHLGLHFCVNLVCGPPGIASAILLRAGEVVEGEPLARSRRQAAGVTRRDVDLASGPARLAVALGLDLRHNGVDVIGSGSIRLHLSDPHANIVTGPRVGIRGEGGDGIKHPWRFWIKDDATVSAYRRA